MQIHDGIAPLTSLISITNLSTANLAVAEEFSSRRKGNWSVSGMDLRPCLNLDADDFGAIRQIIEEFSKRCAIKHRVAHRRRRWTLRIKVKGVRFIHRGNSPLSNGKLTWSSTADGA